MSMPPNSGKYAYCAASHADGRSIPAHRQRRQPETRRLPAIGWSACGGKPETVRSKGFSNGVLQALDLHSKRSLRKGSGNAGAAALFRKRAACLADSSRRIGAEREAPRRRMRAEGIRPAARSERRFPADWTTATYPLWICFRRKKAQKTQTVAVRILRLLRIFAAIVFLHSSAISVPACQD